MRDSGTGAVTYLHSDHLGSVSLATANSGSGPAVASEQLFTPWGSVRAGGIGQTRMNYTGQRLDGSGLLYYHARSYDPALARFISPDGIIPEPANPQAFNRYSYVLNNPLRYMDPTGHCSFDAAGNIDRWDCKVEEFDAMSIAERTHWTEQFMAQTGCTNCFNNILGVLDFFNAEGIGQSGTWLSMVDAGILQGISLGYGNYLHSKGQGPAMKNVNWGAKRWTSFFTEFFNNLPFDDQKSSRLRKLWGEAEQQSTDYAVWYAKQRHGLGPTWREKGLIVATQGYRWAVRLGGGDSTRYLDPFDSRQRRYVFDLAVSYWETTKLVCGQACDQSYP